MTPKHSTRKQSDKRPPRAAKAIAALVAGIICVCLSGGVAACGSAGVQGEGSIGAIRPAKITVPIDREVAAIVDPSASFPRPYLTQSLRILAAAARAVPGELPNRGAFQGQPGIHFSLRVISGDSYTPDALKLDEHLPGVPAIDAISADKNGDFNTQNALDVSAQRKAAESALENSKRVSGRLASELGALNLPVTHCSDVEGAVSAAAESFSKTPGVVHVLIVISDFGQACEANISGSLAAVDFLGVLVCPRSAICRAREDAWDKRLGDARSYKFVRLEDATDMVRSYVTGGGL